LVVFFYPAKFGGGALINRGSISSPSRYQPKGLRPQSPPASIRPFWYVFHGLPCISCLAGADPSLTTHFELHPCNEQPAPHRSVRLRPFERGQRLRFLMPCSFFSQPPTTAISLRSISFLPLSSASRKEDLRLFKVRESVSVFFLTPPPWDATITAGWVFFFLPQFPTPRNFPVCSATGGMLPRSR